MDEQIIKSYNEAIFDTDRDRAFKIIYDALEKGKKPEEIIFNIIIPSLEKMIDNLTNTKTTNLAQHFIASQIASELTLDMISKFKLSQKSIGRIVIGTSFGDFHGLGKTIVSGCLRANMIEVVDLGLNVTPTKFVDEALNNNANIIAISSMMYHTAVSENGSIGVRRILMERGLENSIKIVVGGAPYRYDDELYKLVNADAWADNAISAVKVITSLIQVTL